MTLHGPSRHLRTVPPAAPDPLIGKVVRLPVTGRALVLDIEHEYDDGTTLRYLEGDLAGQLTMRDTFAVRRYPVEPS